jgi:hypothetical protein
MFYDWLRIFDVECVEHPCVVILPSFCSSKKDKKEIKTLGSPPGDLALCCCAQKVGKKESSLK